MTISVFYYKIYIHTHTYLGVTAFLVLVTAFLVCDKITVVFFVPSSPLLAVIVSPQEMSIMCSTSEYYGAL